MYARLTLAVLMSVATLLASCQLTEVPLPGAAASDGDTVEVNDNVGGDTGGDLSPVCDCGTSSGPVAAPQHLMTLAGQTSWFASPLVYDLDGNGTNELIAAYYSVYVFDSSGNLLDRADDGEGARVRAARGRRPGRRRNHRSRRRQRQTRLGLGVALRSPGGQARMARRHHHRRRVARGARPGRGPI